MSIPGKILLTICATGNKIYAIKEMDMGKTRFITKMGFLVPLIFMITASVSISAESGVIFGHVYDKKSGAPIQGATVNLLEGTSYAVSGIDGYYEIENIEDEFSSVETRFDGYRKSEKSYIQKNTETDFYLEKLHIDIYSTVTKRIITSEMLDEDPSTDIRDIVNREPGILEGKYIRGGRYNETGFYSDDVNINASDSKNSLYLNGTFNVSSIVFSPSAFNEGFSDNISGVIKTYSGLFSSEKPLLVRYEGNSILPKEMNYGYNRLNIIYQGSCNKGATQYLFNIDANQAKTLSPLFMNKPDFLYANDSTGYAYSCELHDYFWNTDSTIDSSGTVMRWTEDSIPYFEAVYETMINPISGDREIVRHVYIDTVTGNNYTPEYFDTIGTRTPHSKNIEYSFFGKIGTMVSTKLYVELSGGAYLKANELFTNLYIAYPDKFLAASSKFWNINGYSRWKLNEKTQIELKAYMIHSKRIIAPEFNDTVFDYIDENSCDTIIPEKQNFYEQFMNPLYQMDSLTFSKVSSRYNYYTDNPLLYVNTSWYPEMGNTDEDKNGIEGRIKGNLGSSNTASVGVGIRETNISYSELLYWLIFDYSGKITQKYLFFEDEMFTENTRIKTAVKLDQIKPVVFDTDTTTYVHDYYKDIPERSTLSFSFSMNHNISENQGIRLSYESARQNGTSDALFENTGNFTNLRYIIGNPSADFEKSETFEIGYSFENKNGIYFDASSYYREIRDIIFGETNIYSYYGYFWEPDYIYSNLGQINSKGIEVKVGADKGIVAIEANYSYAVTKGNYSIDYIYLTGYFDYNYLVYIPGEYRVVIGDDPYGGEVFSRKSFYKAYDRRHKLTVKNILRLGIDNSKNENDKLIISLFHSIISGKPAGEALYNSDRSPMVYIADGKLSKNFTLGKLNLEFYISIMNIFNSKSALSIYPVTLSADTSQEYLDIEESTFQDYIIGDSEYDVRLDSDKNGRVTSEEIYGFLRSRTIYLSSSPSVFTKPRNISLGVVFSF